MTPSFEVFINETVIPRNWKTLSKRFDVSTWTRTMQRMKIIGEIVEFHEALENYRVMATPRNFELLELELADIIISCCTLIRLQDRRFSYIPVNHVDEPIEWIHLIYARSTNLCVSSVASYGRKIGINVEDVITRKLIYNTKRKDW